MNFRNISAYTTFSIILLGIILLNACTQERFTDSPSVTLRFETDTITFDTIFTAVGSTTNFLKIYNDESQAVIVSSINIGGGDNSFYRMNVNGTPGSSVSDVEIGANDSLYVFVETTIDPTDENTPFLITDSLVFETNGNFQKVDLVAYGQNANYFSNVAICDEVFTNEKPYLLYNDIIIPDTCTLTIKEGVRLFMHPNSNIYVLGTLLIEGTKDSIVTFQGDRLEDYFDDLVAQWNGIYLLRGSNANVNYAEINESKDGITVGFPFISEEEILDNRTPVLNITNSSIKNCLSRNILGLRAEINATNCLFTNSSLYNLEVANGGTYNFKHCTVANYGVGSISHRDPILRMANYARLGDAIFIGEQMNLNFENSIIHGSEDEEIFIDDHSVEEGFPINYNFNHCLLKTELNTDSIGYNEIENFGFNNCIINPIAADTLFISKFENDFHLNNESPAINAGFSSSILFDIEQNLRDEQPDLGCYEFME